MRKGVADLARDFLCMLTQSGGYSQNFWIFAKSSYKTHVLHNPESVHEDREAVLEDPDPPDLTM